MSDTYEFKASDQVSDKAPAGAINGLVCAFALLIDVLELNGALQPKQFEGVLNAVLKHAGADADDADTAVLQQIMSLLQAPDRPSLTVISGGKN